MVTAFTGSMVAACTPALVDAAERDAELADLFARLQRPTTQTLVAAIVDGGEAGD